MKTPQEVRLIDKISAFLASSNIKIYWCKYRDDLYFTDEYDNEVSSADIEDAMNQDLLEEDR